MRYLQQQQSQNQPPVLLHVLHAKVDVRLLDALGAPSSKYEAVQRVLTEQQSADSNDSSSQSTHTHNKYKTTLDKTPSKSTVRTYTIKQSHVQCSKIRRNVQYQKYKNTLFAFSKMAKTQFLHQKKVRKLHFW